MKFSRPNILLLVVLSMLLGAEAYFGYRLHALSREQEQLKEDYSLANNVTFGLFSIDQWRDRLAAVVNGQVQDYRVTKAQKADLQAVVEKQLHAMVAKTVAEINKPQKTLGGKLKKLAFNSLADSNQLQSQVRPFAKTIMAKVSSPASQERLKGIATHKLNQLEQQTYDSTSIANYAVTKYLYQKYRVTNPIAFNNQLNAHIISARMQSYRQLWAMLGCVLIALTLWWLFRKQVQLQTALFILALLFALVLLAVGLTTSVIEVDARIKTLHFQLLGEKVEFLNQVLFYQRKSIWGVVTTLINQRKPDAIVVGALILLFVIILPFVRLFAKGIHILSPKKFTQNKVLNYLAFEAGKWDMADVMIIGMLMTYIGLNGILKSQLSNLNMHSGSLIMETVNDTSLQPGYFVFTGYVLFAILLAYILKRITLHQTKAK